MSAFDDVEEWITAHERMVWYSENPQFYYPEEREAAFLYLTQDCDGPLQPETEEETAETISIGIKEYSFVNQIDIDNSLYSPSKENTSFQIKSFWSHYYQKGNCEGYAPRGAIAGRQYKL